MIEFLSCYFLLVLVFFGSFAFNNQNFAQTKEHLARTCVPTSPAFRNSGERGEWRVTSEQWTETGADLA